MYPVRFRINYTSVTMELLDFGFPEPNDPFVTSPVVRVDTDEKGELWTVPDPKIWVGDSVYGFKNGALVYALQMTGSAAYTYLQCGEW